MEEDIIQQYQGPLINYNTLWITILLAVLTLAVPKRYFTLPYMLGACFIPGDQRLLILGLNFTVLRILVVAGVFRLLFRCETKPINWNRYDKLVFIWAITGAVIYVIHGFTTQAVIFQSGILFDILGLYWLFRQSIRTWPDVIFVFKLLTYCCLALGPFIAYEWITGTNPFALLGRVETAVREGRYRCQGPFPHSLMLGLFWATIFPLFAGLVIVERNNPLYWMAAGMSAFIVCATASSTPVFTLAQVIGMLMLFNYRRYGKLAAWGLLAVTVALHLVMKSPVWHLLARANVVSGSTGWQRYFLIDQTVNHFSEWVWFGTDKTADWGNALGDITNQYVLEGVRGGLITLILFVILLIMTIKITGAFSRRPMPRIHQWFAWGICVSMLGHCLSFLGVSYFGQIEMLLYMMLAITGFIASLEAVKATSAPEPIYQALQSKTLRPLNAVQI